MLLKNCFLGLVNSRLLHWIWIEVKSVQIVVVGVEAVVPAGDSIGINQGNDLEYVFIE